MRLHPCRPLADAAAALYHIVRYVTRTSLFSLFGMMLEEADGLPGEATPSFDLC